MYSSKDALRSEVELELATAKQKISSIQRSMEACEYSSLYFLCSLYECSTRLVTGRAVRKRSNEPNGGPRRKFTGQPLIAPQSWKEEGAERGASMNSMTVLKMFIVSGTADDFRSAMHQANNAIKTLLHLSRQHSHNHSTSSIPSPSTSPSTSTLPNPATATEAELNRARIETMNKLIGILQRNLRVRYELDVAEVVHALVFPDTSRHLRLKLMDLQRAALTRGQGDEASTRDRLSPNPTFLSRHPLCETSGGAKP